MHSTLTSTDPPARHAVESPVCSVHVGTAGRIPLWYADSRAVGPPATGRRYPRRGAGKVDSGCVGCVDVDLCQHVGMGDLEPGGAGPAMYDSQTLIRALDHLPAMVAYWDSAACNRLANAAYVEWFGKSPEQMLGMHIRDLLGPEIYARNLPYIRGALAGEEQLFERTLVDTSGRTRYTQAQYIPDHGADGRVHGFFVLVTDITRRVQAESSLQDTRAKLVLHDERERIAANLHDIVIQRLYATAMNLAGTAGRLSGDLQARVNQAVDEVDEAMTSLRDAIAPLRLGVAPPDPRQDAIDLINSLESVLGFAPTLSFIDPPELIPAHAVPDLLAVLREALSNVAKHASATAVHVSISTLGGEVCLIVADNGHGMNDTTRSSGLSNMRMRANRLGGTVRIFPNDPHGTVVDWRIPAAATPQRQK